MTRIKTLSALLAATAVALPAFSFAQDRDDRHDDHRDDHRVEQRHDDRHHARDWHKGDHVPAAYRDKRYVVNDWQSHHLNAPPRGYHWVQVDGDFVLAAVATGVIADILLNN